MAQTSLEVIRVSVGLGIVDVWEGIWEEKGGIRTLVSHALIS